MDIKVGRTAKTKTLRNVMVHATVVGIHIHGDTVDGKGKSVPVKVFLSTEDSDRVEKKIRLRKSLLAQFPSSKADLPIFPTE